MSGEAERGWKLVPVEPTPEMLRAGIDNCAVSIRQDRAGNRQMTTPFDDECGSIYRAMLAASPPPPASEAGDAGSAIVERLRALCTDLDGNQLPDLALPGGGVSVADLRDAKATILALQAERQKLRDEIDSFWPNSHVSAVWKIVGDLGDFSAAEVVSQAGLPRKATYNALTYLAKQGKIVRRGYGQYALQSPGGIDQ